MLKTVTTVLSYGTWKLTSFRKCWLGIDFTVFREFLIGQDIGKGAMHGVYVVK